MRMRPRPSLRTVRSRFTALYGVVFLLSGAGLLAIVAIVASGGSRVSESAPANGPIPESQARVHQLQDELAQMHTDQARQLLLASLIALGVMAAVSVVLGRLIAGRVLRPLRTMTTATRRISADNLHERLAVPGPADEVKDLADTIDELLERLENAFAAQRRFVADASHELRTPLATMRASLDVAVAKPGPVPAQTTALAGRLRAELDQIDELLDGFLVLARTRHGEPPDRTPLPFGPVVSAALSARAADIAAKGLTVHETIDRDDARVRGSRTLLRRMIDNVVDNAIAHNHDGGWIRLATATDGATVHLVVETGGPVLDPGEVAELAQPFRRLGADRTGTGAGLGLSIVAAIAAAHGGELDLRARPEGGLRVGVSLPAHTADSAPAGVPS
ncbi:sensor histidine kinase [Actinoallomurus acaciae]|uniref:histidine kinase n=1 Tax=Actinoallomurus acaciae TaxID=502577 RepID=A0ABV5Y7B4_9ACTN